MSLCGATTCRPTTTTTELLLAATEGDRSAWHALLHRFEPAVAGVISTYRLQDADARDAEQHTWLQMIEHHEQVREPEALAGWLKTTAKRECLRIIREQRWVTPYDPDAADPADPMIDVEREVIDAEMARRVRSLLDELPARSAELLLSLFQDDPPAYAELARAIGIPVGSIGPTRARALNRLRVLLEEKEPRSSRSGCPP